MSRPKFTTLREVFDTVKKELAGDLINQNETIWTDEDVAKELGYKVGTIRNMTASGEIPHHKLSGKKTIYLKGEIISWIKNNGIVINKLNINQEGFSEEPAPTRRGMDFQKEF